MDIDMRNIIVKESGKSGISDQEMCLALKRSLENYPDIRKVLILPPDFTRAHSGAGKITAMYYELLKNSCQVDILPALGTHEPMTEQEGAEMFGASVPTDRIIAHDWKNDVEKIGEVPREFVNKVSEGLVDSSIDVEINRRLLDRSYDLIISVGQVVPHEVVGMANYSKNIFVGCGGKSMINQTHMLGAFYGMERILGRDFSPVRKVFDYAEENYLQGIPLMYVLTVTSQEEGRTILHGLFLGRERKVFEEAVALSQEKNIIFLDRPLKKVVVYLEEKEFKSTWLGNKAIYRTKMAMAAGGELIILAPGVRKFGEDNENDRLIRKYGYMGRKRVLELCRESGELAGNLSVAAHLIHGSSDERFTIHYACEHLTKEEIEKTNFKYLPLEEAYDRYCPQRLKDGFNVMADGEEIFYISNPALGLWTERSSFFRV